MKLTSRHDIEAPLAFVYAQLTDFDQFERMAMRRGAEVERTDSLLQAGPGMAWRLRFAFRGKQRRLVLRLDDAEPGSHLVYGIEGETITGSARVDLLAQSARRTRMTVTGDVQAKTLAARLVLQSMRLAKARVQRRMDGSLGKLVALIESHHRGAPKR